MHQPRLTITLFGGLSIHLDGEIVSGFASRKVEALFVYLVCRRRPVARDELARLLWPQNDLSRGLANLSVALNSLRNSLDDYVISNRETVAFDRNAPHRVDLQGFEDALMRAYARYDHRAGLSRTGALFFRQALALYHGLFLAGFHVRGAPAFDDWVAAEQSRLEQLRIDVLGRLVDFYRERDRPAEALLHAQTLLAADPLEEETHRLLMQLYAVDGRRTMALTQYEQCCRILESELGVDPDPSTVQLFEQIQSDTFPESTAPAPTARPVLHQTLPDHSAPLIGREAELGEIARWLSEPVRPLLTLTGPGGIGKTRLVQEVVRRNLLEFRDGVAYVALEAVPGVAGLLTAVADGINLPPASLSEPRQAILQHLQDRELLLVLDNMEHLLSGASREFLGSLIEAAPEVRLLVTSRRRLGVDAEETMTLSGLAYRSADEDFATVDATPAGQLFLSRARPLIGNAGLAGQEAHLAELCGLVEGLPLALELAASWIRALSIAEIVEEVRRNMQALAASSRDLPVRHQSLQAVMDSSWQLLSPEEQDVFARLAVFRGGFTAEAASAVVGADEAMLARLADNSLLRSDGTESPPRYRRHPLLRQYADAKLRARTDASTVRAAHAAYYGRFLQQQEAFLLGRSPERSLPLVRRDVENIKLAWAWAAEQRDSVIINQMGDSIMQAFDLFGLYQDVVTMANQALASYAGATLEEAEEAVAVGRILGLAGAFAFRRGEYETAQDRCRASLTVLVAHRPHIAYAHSLIYAGAAAFGLGDFDAVRAHWLAAEQEYAAVDSVWGQTTATINLSEVELLLGNSAEAQTFAQQGYALADSIGNDELKGSPLQVMASIALARGDLDAAQRYAEEAVACHRRTRHDAHLGNALARLGSVRAAQGDLPGARDNLAESVQILQASGNHLYFVTHLVELGRIRRDMGDLAGAEEAFRDAARDAMKSQTVEVVLRALSHQADICARTGRDADARRLARFVTQHDGAVADVTALAEEVLSRTDPADDELRPDPTGAKDPPSALADAVALALGRPLRGPVLPALQARLRR